MNSIIMPKPDHLNDETKKQLSEEVKEKLATEEAKVENNEKTKFTAMDMWNRNRHSRSASSMMRRWNLN